MLVENQIYITEQVTVEQAARFRSGDWVDLFHARCNDYFESPIHLLLRLSHTSPHTSGFSSLLLIGAFTEFLARVLIGGGTFQRETRRQHIAFLERTGSYAPFKHEVYKNVRCGLSHAGILDEGFLCSFTGRDPRGPERVDRGLVVIDPRHLFGEIQATRDTLAREIGDASLAHATRALFDPLIALALRRSA
jgi:hypothetical protein